MRFASPTIPMLASLLLVAAASSSCKESEATAKKGKGASTADERAPLVRVEPVAKRQVRRKIETTSYLESEHSVVVLSRVVGRVLEVKVDEGQKVTKGELLAILDDREIRATLQQISSQVQDKKHRLELAKLEVEATQHRQEQAQSDLAKAEKDLQRLTELDPELVSPRELDDAKFAKDKAGAALKVAEFMTRKAKLDVTTAQQTITEWQAKESETEIQAEEHKIVAPFSGVVSARMVKGGEAITTATELFRVVDTENLIAYLDRPQQELGMVQKAKAVVFTTDAYPNREFMADVDVISPVVERETGSFRIRVRVRPDDAAALRPGLFMRAEILTEENREAIMIPKTAVLADGDDSVVFFIRDPLDGRGKARRLRLETGIEDDTSVECRNSGAQGLRPGDLIIVSGQQDLKDQTEVEISAN